MTRACVDVKVAAKVPNLPAIPGVETVNAIIASGKEDSIVDYAWRRFDMVAGRDLPLFETGLSVKTIELADVIAVHSFTDVDSPS